MDLDFYPLGWILLTYTQGGRKVILDGGLLFIRKMVFCIIKPKKMGGPRNTRGPQFRPPAYKQEKCVHSSWTLQEFTPTVKKRYQNQSPSKVVTFLYVGTCRWSTYIPMYFSWFWFRFRYKYLLNLFSEIKTKSFVKRKLWDWDISTKWLEDTVILSLLHLLQYWLTEIIQNSAQIFVLALKRCAFLQVWTKYFEIKTISNLVAV